MHRDQFPNLTDYEFKDKIDKMIKEQKKPYPELILKGPGRNCIAVLQRPPIPSGRKGDREAQKGGVYIAAKE